MNKSAIQKFAIQARIDLKEQVAQRCYQYGITKDGYGVENAVTVMGRALSNQEQEQRWQLIQEIKKKGYDQVIEEVAYTWFNRFIALRFMEVNNYLPSHVRVFSDSTGAFKPEILSDVIHLDLPGLDMGKVTDLVEKNQTEELYRYLLLTQCNALNEALPRMFEKMGGFTELLLPNNILRPDSVLGRMVADIPEEDWTDQVQIIGWLYQYYIAERHNQVVNVLGKSTIKKEDIPAATQLFTTDWVVRYMVDNSLGRYWLERHPESKLEEKLKFFVKPKSGVIQHVNESIAPQDLTFFDPCMGSGHILVYAFEVFMEIYKECGYGERDAAAEIVKNNLFGLDIDNRCSQLSYFAIQMKARSYDRRFFTRGVNPHIISIEESNTLSRFTHTGFMPDEKHNQIGEYLIEIFRHAKEIGSLKSVASNNYEAFQKYLSDCSESEVFDIEFAQWQTEEMPIMIHLAEQAKILSKKYCVVCTNPPYLNRMEGHLKDFVQTEYKEYSTDLFAAFEIRNLDFCVNNGYSAYMTPNAWMFLVSYAKLRNYILSRYHISSFVHIAKGSFFKEATVDICSFVIQKTKSDTVSSFISLEKYKNDMDSQRDGLLVETERAEHQYDIHQSTLMSLPDCAFAYWTSEKTQKIYKNDNLYKRTTSDGQNITGNNDRFLRYSWEVDATSVGTNKHWSLCAKGGQYRKWYGNIIDLIDWSEAARLHYRTDKIARIVPEYLWFKKCITWSNITSYKASFRIVEEGKLFEKKGASIFINNDDEYNIILAMLNSAVAEYLLNMITQAISYQVRDIRSIPFILPCDSQIAVINSTCNECINISRADWDSFETSWDFRKHPLV